MFLDELNDEELQFVQDCLDKGCELVDNTSHRRMRNGEYEYSQQIETWRFTDVSNRTWHFMINCIGSPYHYWNVYLDEDLDRNLHNSMHVFETRETPSSFDFYQLLEMALTCPECGVSFTECVCPDCGMEANAETGYFCPSCDRVVGLTNIHGYGFAGRGCSECAGIGQAKWQNEVDRYGLD